MRDTQTADPFSGAFVDVCNATYSLGEAALDLFYNSQQSPITLTALGHTYRCVFNPLTHKVEIEQLWQRRKTP